MPSVLANVRRPRSGPSFATGFIGCCKTGGSLPQKKERKTNKQIPLGCLCSSQGLGGAARKRGKPRHRSITGCMHGPRLRRRQQQQGVKGFSELVAGQSPRWPFLTLTQRWPQQPRCLTCGSLPSPWHRLASPASLGGPGQMHSRSRCVLHLAISALKSPLLPSSRALQCRHGAVSGWDSSGRREQPRGEDFSVPLLAAKQRRKQSAGTKMNFPSLDLCKKRGIFHTWQGLASAKRFWPLECIADERKRLGFTLYRPPCWHYCAEPIHLH